MHRKNQKAYTCANEEIKNRKNGFNGSIESASTVLPRNKMKIGCK